MKKRRSALRALLLIAGAAVLLFVLVFAWYSRDDALPDDADLRLKVEDVPDAANGFYFLCLATDAHRLPKFTRTGPNEVSVLRPGAWDQEFVDKILAMNEDAFRLLAQGLECERWQLPIVRDFSEPLPGLPGFRSLARVMRVRSEDSFRKGLEAAAFEEAMAVVRLGWIVEANANCLITYIVASAVRGMGLIQIRSMLERTTLAPDELRPYVQEMGRYGPSAEGLARAYKAEYAMDCSEIDQIAAGWLLSHETGTEPSSRRPNPAAIRASRRLRNTFQLKPNRTKAMLARSTRGFIRNASKPYGDRELIPASDVMSRTGRRRLALQGNLLGEEQHYAFVFGLFLHGIKSGAVSGVAATRILIALKCYKIEHGDLPETLDALVPDYFDAVPLDDFDGKPMKYSRDKRVVYAVGTDLTDNGGIAEDDREGVNADGYDLTYKIEF